MKIVFMGTPDFSVEPLKELVKAGHDVSLVLTREDKKRNRGELSPTPVKELALSLNIPVLTPSKMKDEALRDLSLKMPTFLWLWRMERFYRRLFLIYRNSDV